MLNDVLSCKRGKHVRYNSTLIAGGVDPNWLLAKGAETGNIIWICRALALGADRNTVAGNDLKRAPIHLAVLSVIIHKLS